MKPMAIEETIKNKRLIAYGAGLAFLGTYESYPLPYCYIVDDTPQIQGRQIKGFPVHPPIFLQSEKKDEIFIIVCANTPKSISLISSSLEQAGFLFGTHFIDCSILHHASVSRKLSESLGIRSHSNTFIKTRSLSLHATHENLSYIAGTWLYIELLDHVCNHLPGSVAECGIFNGGNALIACMISRSLAKKPYHLFDSFRGFPESGDAESAANRDAFSDVEFAGVENAFMQFPNVEIHRGYFRETFPALPPETYCMVYVDCDLYESTLQCCEYFWDRIVKGGLMLFHDYWAPDEELPHRSPFQGTGKAVREFFADRLGEFLVFPETTHALIRK